METNDKQKSWLEVWGGRLLNMVFLFCMLFVVYLASGVFIVTSFRIPSDSMEPSLQTGDYLLVDKCSKGARLFDVFGGNLREIAVRYLGCQRF